MSLVDSFTGSLEAVPISQAPEEYSRWVKNHPLGTFWQSKEFFDFLISRGEYPRAFLFYGDKKPVASCLVTSSKLPFGGVKLHVPRGPLVYDPSLTERVLDYFTGPSVVFAHVENAADHPNLEKQSPLKRKVLSRGIYPSDTLILDLSAGKEQILANMTRKGRYNIKLGTKKGVTVQEDPGPERFIPLQKEFCFRKKLAYHGDDYFKDLSEFLPVRFFSAVIDGKTAASVMILEWNNQAIYYYGASDEGFKNYMAPYVLHWHAISYYIDKKFNIYDFHGIASPERNLNLHLEGVGSFKKRFGGKRVSFGHPYHRINRSRMYGVYSFLTGLRSRFGF